MLFILNLDVKLPPPWAGPVLIQATLGSRVLAVSQWDAAVSLRTVQRRLPQRRQKEEGCPELTGPRISLLVPTGRLSYIGNQTSRTETAAQVFTLDNCRCVLYTGK